MKSLSRILPAAALTIAALVFSGCETESAGTASVNINPGYARIMAGQSVVLSASGGNDYRWSLSNGSYGHLSANRGSSVVYTASKNDVTQIVTLDSTLGSSALQCQATVVQGNAAYASTVTATTSGSASVSGGTQQSSSSSGGNASSTTLSISPSSSELKRGSSQLFTANGDNCVWTLSNPSYGTLDTTTGSTVTYTATRENVTQTLTVSATVNGTKRNARATIRQVTYAAGDTIHLGGN